MDATVSVIFIVFKWVGCGGDEQLLIETLASSPVNVMQFLGLVCLP